jgi:hypothetical protein
MSDSDQKSPITSNVLMCIAFLFSIIFVLFLFIRCSGKAGDVNEKDPTTVDYYNDSLNQSNGFFGLF